MQKRTQEEWLALIEEWKRSKKLITIFCREKNIPKNSLIYWVRRKKTPCNPASLKRSNFVELKDHKTNGDVIEICYNQISVRLPISCNPSLLSCCLKTLKGGK